MAHADKRLCIGVGVDVRVQLIIIECMEVIWKDIKGYEGRYQISNLGEVKSVPRLVANKNGYRKVKERILRKKIDTRGYFVVNLCRNGLHKMYTIHRLVAETFMPNPNQLPQVNHKDENKLNNRLDNLEWCTAKYNTNYGHATTRRSLSVCQYDLNGCKVGWFYGIREAERITGINNRSIRQVLKGERKTAGGYYWIRG